MEVVFYPGRVSIRGQIFVFELPVVSLLPADLLQWLVMECQQRRLLQRLLPWLLPMQRHWTAAVPVPAAVVDGYWH